MAAGLFSIAKEITLDFGSDYLAQLPVERRKLLSEITVAFNNKGLKSEFDYQVHLPSSLIAKLDGQVLHLSNLYESPTDTHEPLSLAIDGNGHRKLLTSEQFEDVSKEAYLKVPSEKYLGRFHIWKLNSILQEGSKNTKIIFEKYMSSSLEHILITIPANFFNADEDSLYLFSVRKGLKVIYHGLFRMLSIAIGLIEEVPKYSRNTIGTMVEKRKNEFIMASLATNAALDASVFRSCLYNIQLSKELRPEIKRIEDEQRSYWDRYKSNHRKQLLKKHKLLSPESTRSHREALVMNDLKNKEFEVLNHHFRTDAILSKLNPGYGVLVANHRSALKITDEETEKLNKILHEKGIEIRQQLVAKHSILSRIEGWLEPRVARQVEEFHQAILWMHLNEISTRLAANKLHLESYIGREEVKFKEVEERYRKELASVKRPAEIIEIECRIWNSEKWIVAASYRENGSISHYYPKMHETVSVPTDLFCWRLILVLHRTKGFFKNGLYYMMVENLWNGSLGLRAMFASSCSFLPHTIMDSRTGSIRDDPSFVRSTYIGNLEAALTRYREAHHRFEIARDIGLLGKGITRPFFSIYQFGLFGASLVVIAIGQPVLTAINAAVGIIFAATSPIWAPGCGVLMLIFCWILYDFDMARAEADMGSYYAIFPVLTNALDMTFRGLGPVVVKSAQSVFYDAPMAVIKGIFSYVRWGARSAWDYLLRGCLHSRMKVPGVNSFWAYRTHGPGLSSQYHYQVEPEIAIMAMQATLEMEELNLYTIHQKEKIDKPLIDFYGFFRNFMAPLVIDASFLPLTHALEAEKKRNHVLLREALDRREKNFSSVLYVPVSKRLLIRLTEENLQKTLNYSEHIVASFYIDHLTGLMDEEKTAAYWDSKGLDENDFEGLTGYYYTKAFHSDFLVPLQRMDYDFAIKVTQPSWKDIVTYFPYAAQETPKTNTESFI
jgi:hypothetical protein